MQYHDIMNASDLSERSQHEPGNPSPKGSRSLDFAQRASSESDRSGSERSSSTSRPNPNNHQQQQHPFNEATPIVSNSGSAGRRYQSTDSQMGSDSARRNGRPKEPSQGRARNNGDQGSGSSSSRDRGDPWYRRVADKFGTVQLDNKGSVARDHLALERTFLAWLRTSLAFASIGIAVTQLFRLSSTGRIVDGPAIFPGLVSPSLDDPMMQRSSDSARLRGIGKPLGTTFVGIAILVLLIGFHRYFESQYWIIRGKFPASRGSIALIAIVTGALIIAAFIVILSVAPNVVER